MGIIIIIIIFIIWGYILKNKKKKKRRRNQKKGNYEWGKRDLNIYKFSGKKKYKNIKKEVE